MIHRAYGASFKFRSHKWWWDRWWDSSSLWSFGGSMNGFLQALGSKTFKKAPTWEVFASIFEVLNEALTEQRFAIKSSSNFNEKKPLKDLDQLEEIFWQLWFNAGKITKRFVIINPVLPDTHQGLDNIASCPEDTSILNVAEDNDSGEDSDEDDDQEINIEQEIN